MSYNISFTRKQYSIKHRKSGLHQRDGGGAIHEAAYELGHGFLHGVDRGAGHGVSHSVGHLHCSVSGGVKHCQRHNGPGVLSP